jgi:hypothetical protein
MLLQKVYWGMKRKTSTWLRKNVYTLITVLDDAKNQNNK